MDIIQHAVGKTSEIIVKNLSLTQNKEAPVFLFSRKDVAIWKWTL